MIKRTFAEVSAMSCGTAAAADYDGSLLIQGVSKDTRTLQPGNLYVPLIGESFDGHRFLDDAIAKGASASLWQRDHELPPHSIPFILVEDTLAALQQLAKNYRSELDIRIVGITGSNGKTTTKDMTASVLSTTFKVHKTLGNYNNHIGLPLTLLQLEEDTAVAVLEMGMSGRGEIRFLSELAEPEVVVITNIGEAHLLQLGSREEIARAKTEILAGLQQDGTLIYFGDEPLIDKVLPELQAADGMKAHRYDRVRFGASSNNEWFPVETKTDTAGTHFRLNRMESTEFYIPLLGFHNVINSLAAIAVGVHFGVPSTAIADGLKKSVMTSMRIELMKAPSGLTILNDAYNASPASMKAALKLLVELTGYSRKIAVLGDMLELGDQEVEFHREIGRILNPKEIDRVFVFGQLSEHLADEASRKYPPGKVVVFDDKNRLAQALASFTASDDIVLVKGSRGMKLEQVVALLQQV
ncbi:UDP-N-acetylmuramoyl-tripeptide--D-alanyl-D-alanine ligase [Paenibacillus radicis (ex Xue et al. 2023)]|uniref:UDP-N-acetylmuramoyl-tripeptide--D-alanyl-D-alanine ligase n=1 Tax=Paenibacillus radicis (ex Xue et al. 2023) TaxID=2972489 RepID=A0ABT1YP72_9BACL|nr:UDP-N-acetylmuramoyl-tripeptide--D-alanyl-D-alanine ligase [Paenibacillus radicis (ex Xue et al. 2023)]MCR8634967.1 UDP-N-acetylmuramoyl-tripeptide--D-alanyl-D-alanine ligase [Paenibacillus radicis (ex Xue et al. 2023)]